ncbi:MAG: ABC transporter permease [Gammaproteobacteria bacterium]|nr:ABC transporter permease [Gammaproteobacteria bacterium]
MHRIIHGWWFFPISGLSILLLLLNVLPSVFAVKATYLWTDIFIFILLVMVVIFVAYIRSKEHLSRPWAKVFERKLPMASVVVLLVFIVIGLMDSIHFRMPLPSEHNETVHYSVDVSSVLDVLTSELHTRDEKTYSAPFAAYSFVKESVDLPGGGSERIYPRLKYAGSHLDDPDKQIADDITFRIIKSLWQTIASGVIFFAALIFIASIKLKKSFAEVVRGVLQNNTRLSWRTAILVMWLILFIIVFLVNTSTFYHIFGTDKVGQDVLYLSLKSIRTGLVIGSLTTMVMLPFAIMMGIAAGYFQGWIDDVIQYIYTTLNSIPGVLLIAAAILSIQVYISNHPELFATSIERADLRLLALCFILGITSWTGLCRLLRGEAFKIRELEYIQAAQAFGVSHFRIISRHILPNIMHIVLIVVVLDFSGLVLAEAVLSYVGVGVDPSTNSWGNMINGARLEMAREPLVWWSLVAAFSFMFVLVLAANLFSDAVRDAFDPRAQRDG